ncbi:MAG: hypothetical protein QNJ09_18415 [Paracoccaceae bacterium]|nr:hypothetical protein [Paracoccaceae bacterium]
MLIKALNNRMRRFSEDTSGYITIESMIVMPALLWFFAVGWVYFDAFRQQSVNQKANYTIGDMISRETDVVSDQYIDNAGELLRWLTKSDSTATELRVTVVYYDGNTDSWHVVWSKESGTKGILTDGDLGTFAGRLPAVQGGDALILVETWDDHEPVFDVGLAPYEIQTYSFTRPRFAPQVVYAPTSSGRVGEQKLAELKKPDTGPVTIAPPPVKQDD